MLIILEFYIDWEHKNEHKKNENIFSLKCEKLNVFC